MKKLEIILVVIAIAAIFMNYTEIPGGGFLTVLSLAALAVFYLFYKEAWVKNNTIAGGISNWNPLGLGLSILVIGILFKLQIWPNAKFFLITGVGSVLFFAWLNYRRNAALENSQGNKTGIIRIAGFIAVGILLLIIPNSSLVENRFKNYPDYIQAWKDADAHPDSLPLQSKRDEEFVRMSEQKVKNIIEKDK